MNFVKPNIVVSKCLGFEKCRFNGQVLHSEFIDHFKSFMNIYTVCPEVEIGLGVPRDPIRIIREDEKNKLVDSETGEEHTEKMNKFSEKYLDSLENIDGFILKNRSPSCGVKDVKIYKSSGEYRPLNEKTSGFFAKNAMEKFPDLAFEDDGRLMNFRIRENFLIQIYTLSKFREIGEKMKMHDIIEFHSTNKYLFMAYDQEILKKLGKITANHEDLPIETVYQKYKETMSGLFENFRTDGMNINAFMHIFGYFKDLINTKEKEFFLEKLDAYRNNLVPAMVPISILESWVIRFDIDYLKTQTILNPYPDNLMKVTDSGKGREFNR
ncbi:MAG: YbgA family protein [Fusobacteriota bacterium]